MLNPQTNPEFPEGGTPPAAKKAVSGGLREMANADVSSVCDMFNDVYGHPIDAGLWRWKYSAGPRLASFNWVWECADGRLMGHIGASVFPGVHGGRRIAMAQVGDIMLRREARGSMGPSGIYQQLVAAMQQSLLTFHPDLYAYGFPGERPFRLGEKIGFYKRLYACTDYTTWPASRPMSGAGWRSRLYSIDHRVSVLGNEARVHRALDAMWNVQQDKIAAQRDETSVPRLVKDGSYLLWRYFGRTGEAAPTYRLNWLTSLGLKCGWLVTRDMVDGVCVVDGLWQSKASFEASIRALARLRKLPVTTWIPVEGATAKGSPIVTGELAVAGKYTGWRPMTVMPGDTDVY